MDCFETLLMFSASFFGAQNAIKVYLDSGYLVGVTPLTVSTNCFETLQMFSAWIEDVHVVWV